MRSRVPLHPWFAVYWTFLTLAMMARVWFFKDPSWWVDPALIGGFLAPEGWALRYKKEVTFEGRVVALRDTLSWFMTWIAWQSKPGTRWYQSWNALVAGIAGHWSALVYQQHENVVFATGLAAFTFGFLLWHWLRPDTKG